PRRSASGSFGPRPPSSPRTGAARSLRSRAAVLAPTRRGASSPNSSSPTRSSSRISWRPESSYRATPHFWTWEGAPPPPAGARPPRAEARGGPSRKSLLRVSLQWAPGMALKPIGAVFGTVGSSAFRIAVSDNTLRRNDYIKVEHPTCGWVLGQVVDLQRESD